MSLDLPERTCHITSTWKLSEENVKQLPHQALSLQTLFPGCPRNTMTVQSLQAPKSQSCKHADWTASIIATTFHYQSVSTALAEAPSAACAV